MKLSCGGMCRGRCGCGRCGGRCGYQSTVLNPVDGAELQLHLLQVALSHL